MSLYENILGANQFFSFKPCRGGSRGAEGAPTPLPPYSHKTPLEQAVEGREEGRKKKKTKENEVKMEVEGEGSPLPACAATATG